ncbi:unnamed protein product [Pedinophyceae sp. YPF-701]|nr:unnamed protein product [Pedinophyceae sp. YPF-701]
MEPPDADASRTRAPDGNEFDWAKGGLPPGLKRLQSTFILALFAGLMAWTLVHVRTVERPSARQLQSWQATLAAIDASPRPQCKIAMAVGPLVGGQGASWMEFITTSVNTNIREIEGDLMCEPEVTDLVERWAGKAPPTGGLQHTLAIEVLSDKNLAGTGLDSDTVRTVTEHLASADTCTSHVVMGPRRTAYVVVAEPAPACLKPAAYALRRALTVAFGARLPHAAKTPRSADGAPRTAPSDAGAAPLHLPTWHVFPTFAATVGVCRGEAGRAWDWPAVQEAALAGMASALEGVVDFVYHPRELHGLAWPTGAGKWGVERALPDTWEAASELPAAQRAAARSKEPHVAILGDMASEWRDLPGPRVHAIRQVAILPPCKHRPAEFTNGRPSAMLPGPVRATMINAATSGAAAEEGGANAWLDSDDAGASLSGFVDVLVAAVRADLGLHGAPLRAAGRKAKVTAARAEGSAHMTDWELDRVKLAAARLRVAEAVDVMQATIQAARRNSNLRVPAFVQQRLPMCIQVARSASREAAAAPAGNRAAWATVQATARAAVECAHTLSYGSGIEMEPSRGAQHLISLYQPVGLPLVVVTLGAFGAQLRHYMKRRKAVAALTAPHTKQD